MILAVLLLCLLSACTIPPSEPESFEEASARLQYLKQQRAEMKGSVFGDASYDHLSSEEAEQYNRAQKVEDEIENLESWLEINHRQSQKKK